jgi:hypothetical protein
MGADATAIALAARINPATTKAGIKYLVFIFLSSSSRAAVNYSSETTKAEGPVRSHHVCDTFGLRHLPKELRALQCSRDRKMELKWK